jgi:hypothetical protein
MLVLAWPDCVVVQMVDFSMAGLCCNKKRFIFSMNGMCHGENVGFSMSGICCVQHVGFSMAGLCWDKNKNRIVRRPVATISVER